MTAILPKHVGAN